MHYIKKLSNYALMGGLGALLIVGVSGCEQKDRYQSEGAFSQARQKQGAFVVIEEVSPRNYKIVEEYPSERTRVVLRDINGTERILSQEELDRLMRQEATKIEQGQSALVNPELHAGGLSLGEAILASAAGAIIGSWIGSRLFNNPTYQKTRQRSFKSPSAYQRSVNSFTKRTMTKPSTKSGFFKPTSKTSTKRSFFGFGG
ncbi:MAG: hypothetical protein C6H99_04695 [Epsilonproteobacteria bacterium]|nr:hypothetical protein [Campylobacterota bacterium]NPA65014.1 hypothetical protein [Campylobacterota bacterium]